MGTHGLVVFVHRDTYFVYYNHYDSDPSCLGELVVTELDLVDDNIIAGWKDVLDTIECGWTNDNFHIHFEGITRSLSKPFKYLKEVTHVKPYCDINIEWVYFINLDTNIFTVQNWDWEYDYPLMDIPLNWNYDFLPEYTAQSTQYTDLDALYEC